MNDVELKLENNLRSSFLRMALHEVNSHWKLTTRGLGRSSSNGLSAISFAVPVLLGEIK